MFRRPVDHRSLVTSFLPRPITPGEFLYARKKKTAPFRVPVIFFSEEKAV